jgi:hypothetical protein
MAYDGIYLTFKYDRETRYRYEKIKETCPNIKLVRIKKEDWDNNTMAETIMKYVPSVNTKHFWVIDPEVRIPDDFYFDFQTDRWNNKVTHFWNAQTRNDFNRVVGVKLFRTKDVFAGDFDFVNKVYYGDVENVTHNEFSLFSYEPTDEQYDIFYWKKSYGSKNLAKLKERFPYIQSVSAASYVDAHEYCRENSLTDYYYFVTADTEINNDFNFDYEFTFDSDRENKKPVVWPKTNRQTGNIREYHGLGLFSTTGTLYEEDQYRKHNFGRFAVYEKDSHQTDVEFEVYRVTNMTDLKSIDISADTDMYWVIDEQVDVDTDVLKEFIPFSYDRDKIHNFTIKTHNGTYMRNGVRLVSKNYNETKQKDLSDVAGTLRPFERIYARTIEEAVEKAENNRFWMINPDLDLIVDEEFLNNFLPDLYEIDSTHIWKQKSFSGKDLGHGGLALSSKGYDKERTRYMDDVAMTTPEVSRIPKYYDRDPYKVWKKNAKDDTFYWFVDTIVEILDEFNFDFYPDIHSIENVFAFGSEDNTGSGVYLVHRPHLVRHGLKEKDFSFDRFKKIIKVDDVASRTTSHPVFFFYEGMYPENVKKHRDMGIEVLDGRDLAAAYLKAANKTTTGYFWAIDNDVELIKKNFNPAFYVDRFHQSHFQLWPKENPYTGFIHQFGGVKLCPAEAIKHLKPDAEKIRKMNFQNKTPIKTSTPMSRDVPYDVIFLSYNEPFADDNYEKLLRRVPNAKRVHGVKGIFNAHKQAAELATTRMFYVVDADAILLDSFDFEYFPNVWDEDIVHTWKSKNPINGLVYGYGGLKLFPTKLLREAQDWRIDFTTSVSDKFKPMPTVANYTAFNTDPFNTWKSAFRECTKLSSNIIKRSKQDENDERLNIWCTIGAEQPFGEYAIAGANMGKEYGIRNAEDDDALTMINDFEWLKKHFEENYNVTNEYQRAKSEA